MRVTTLMKDRMVMPVLFPASASSSSWLATALHTLMMTGRTTELTSLQNVISQLSQGSSQLLHVQIDGVVVLESTPDICPIFTEIESVVENYFVTEQQQSD